MTARVAVVRGFGRDVGVERHEHVIMLVIVPVRLALDQLEPDDDGVVADEYVLAGAVSNVPSAALPRRVP